MNVGRSFEPPSFGELVNAANNGAGLVQLDAQTATTFEVGTRGHAGRFTWDLACHYAWIDDELLGYNVAPGVTQTVNAGSTIHQGVETAIDINLFAGIFTPGSSTAAKARDGKTELIEVTAPAHDRLLLRQVYLWNDFHFQDDSEFGDNRLAGIPEHYYRAELIYEHPCGFYAGPNVEWCQKNITSTSLNLSSRTLTRSWASRLDTGQIGDSRFSSRQKI